MEESFLQEIKKLKKIELHRHIEGCIDQKFFHKLVLKHDSMGKYAEISSIEELFNFDSFVGFLTAYDAVVGFIREIEDFVELSNHVISQLREENIVYAELIFSPQPFVDKGMDLTDILTNMFDTFKQSGIKTSLIIDIVRNFGVEKGDLFINKLVSTRNSNENLLNWIKAISIGGDEVNYPAILFEDIFKKAKQNGLICYAHAGEWTGHKNIWDSLKSLKVRRIGHGIRAIDDDKLLFYLKENDVTLDISITSNYFTGAVKEGDPHPVKQIFDNGCKITLNTDDPGFFKTDINREYIKFMGLGYDLDDIKSIINNSLNSSFLNKDEKRKIQRLL